MKPEDRSEYEDAFKQALDLAPLPTQRRIMEDIDKICRPVEFMVKSKNIQQALPGALVALGVFLRMNDAIAIAILNEKMNLKQR